MSFTKAAESGNITRFEIYSIYLKESVTTKKPTSLLGGAVELYYYESIFENSVKITTQLLLILEMLYQQMMELVLLWNLLMVLKLVVEKKCSWTLKITKEQN